MAYTYEYPRPAVTVDCVVFGISENRLHIVLVQRGHAPFEGRWALPGGFVQIEESLEEAAQRELSEETGLSPVPLEQFHTFGQPDRDPRGRVISVVYWGLVDMGRNALRAGDDARRAEWFCWSSLPPLAFDHAEIVHRAYQRLVQKARWGPIGREWLPKPFSLRDLQNLYEAIFQRKLSHQKWFRKMLAMGLLRSVGSKTRSTRRPVALYTFSPSVYKQLSLYGFARNLWE